MASAKKKTRKSSRKVEADSPPTAITTDADSGEPDAPDGAASSFESELEQLRKAVERLESPEIDLEDAFAALESGARSYRHCRKILERARERVEVLVGELPDGELQWLPFEGSPEISAESDEDGS